ncbi:hypothetical protein AKJ39_02370 [candidate division MSBL1 archaeon SCGC-AAA259J03]|uniref:BPL/LPL catalytic domain-containing protein n=2 Tax=candidate division MSBL1 TaxID=215777 RepID=A0A656YW66_9EURY|nr:hypothetical protein AKJ61_04515 [candidate division MSBL1 archaeon SCGC-AAA259B11]KXA98220.1 hypothetical protein AKJ39_02370 [candidate division MSBL1 archaeon SCGC-AAA259J03]
MDRPNTRWEILRNLKKSETFLSGEELAKPLGVSRISVWKHIQNLKKMGYEIESKRGEGYKLLEPPDKLLPPEILPLDTEIVGREIIHYEEVKSTNLKMREKSEEEEGLIILAERQTEGKGRLGRNWKSPKGGIWMSVLLKPNIPPVETPLLTMISSTSVFESLQEIGIEGSIKWPNDVLVDGEKICGILTEMDAEMGALNYVIIGIGLNVNFDKNELPDTGATTVQSILEEKVDRKALTGSIITNLDKWYRKLKKNSKEEILDSWRANSHNLGRKVDVEMVTGESFTGTAVDFTDTGGLVVKGENGSERTFLSGDVTLSSDSR